MVLLYHQQSLGFSQEIYFAVWAVGQDCGQKLISSSCQMPLRDLVTCAVGLSDPPSACHKWSSVVVYIACS